LLGETEIDPEPMNGCDISLGTAAFALEDALQTGNRADDEADILAAVAFEYADLDPLLRARARE
jgi:hypothetical protein